jgi:hypothetical protein
LRKPPIAAKQETFSCRLLKTQFGMQPSRGVRRAVSLSGAIGFPGLNELAGRGHGERESGHICYFKTYIQERLFRGNAAGTED